MLKKYSFTVLLLLLPLLFINIRDSHDWGDDFAQYLIQAGNITESHPQTENGLVSDEISGGFAVKAYPVGFPLLLSPVYALSGIEIRPYLILETIFLIVLSWLCWNYFRKFFDERLALLLMLFFAYHYLTLDLKGQILSEIPFTLFLLLLVSMFRSGKNTIRHWLVLGILCGFLSSIRILGAISLPALAAFLLMSYLKGEAGEKYGKLNRKKVFLFFTLISACTFFLLNSILFKIPVGDFLEFYRDAGSDHPTHFFSNLFVYLNHIGRIFQLPFVHASVWTYMCGILMLTGLLRALFRNDGVEAWWLLFYLLILGFYPYPSGGFRFLFPVFPFLILYFFEGLQIISSRIKSGLERKSSYAASLLLLAALIQPIYQIVATTGVSVDGPQSKDAKEMFEYLRNKTSRDAVVVFPRARAMALYSEHPSTYLIQKNTTAENDQLFKRLNVKMLVVAKENEKSPLYDPALWDYLKVYRSALQLKWQNEAFEVYGMSYD